MKRLTAYLVAGAVAALSVSVPNVAGAFERTQTCDPNGTFECDSDETPRPISWPVRCINYRINDSGSSDIGGDGLDDRLGKVVVDSFDAWESPSCTDLGLVRGSDTSNSRARYREDAGFEDNMNLVVWRDEDWPYPGSKYAFALTSVTYDSDDGTITDADLEVNTSQYEFADLSESRTDEANAPVDMGNTLTHEVGHFVGLAHPDEPEDATMNGTAQRGEIKKRTLHQDDIDGVCAIYPKPDESDEVATCSTRREFVPPRARDTNEHPVEGCGCASTAGDAGFAGNMVYGILLLLALSLRRRTTDDGMS